MPKFKIVLDRKPKRARIVSAYKFEALKRKKEAEEEKPKEIELEEIENFISATLEDIEKKERIDKIVREVGDKFIDEFKINNVGQPVEISLSKIRKKVLPLEEAKKQIQQAYDSGFEDGKKMTEAAFRSELEVREKWIRRIDSVIEELRKNYADEINAVRNTVPELAVQIAEIILGREASQNALLAVEQVERALELLDGDKTFKIRVNPEDLEILKEAKIETLSKRADAKEVEIVPDSSVDKGSCVLETSAGEIDARFKTRLAKLKEKIADEISKD